MARQAAKSGDESIQGYFRPILEENPKKYLRNRDNSELYERWLKDHPGHTEIPHSVKNSLNNLKSRLRKERKMGKRRRKVEADEPAAPVKVSRKTAGNLQALEEQIDECLGMAKTVDREGLTEVIDLLRQARNQVIARVIGPALAR
ncbi:MAG: hypothetical protein L0Z62_20885 [Gemmataceae bacterium]|nr:hypothetical protein [Gemmataceae bacterium]